MGLWKFSTVVNGRPGLLTLASSGPILITQGKLNAIRAALEAGVKPNAIARQFGVAPAIIKKAVEGS